MPKPKPSKRPAERTRSPVGRAPSLPALEARIERLDRELVGLLNERAQLAAEAGKLQHAAGQPLFSLAREDELVARALQWSKGPLSARALKAALREMLAGARSILKELRVSFLGPLYSYSHLAAIHRFGQSVELTPVGTIAAVFEEVNRGQADFGIVPLENSTDGRIADTLEMFTRLPVRICGEVELEIHHTLLGKCPRAEVREVYSRPQALSQCRNWLAKHLPAARLIEVTSTSTAAQLASEKPGAAAVASVQAGVHYGLGVLAERIEDNLGNATRFAVIGDLQPPRTGRDKTAMMFQIEHKPGSLADAIHVFKRNRLNLTWIESFPVPGTRGSYLFFVEMEAHQSEPRVRRAVDSLAQKALRLEILGSFPADRAAAEDRPAR